MAPRWARQEELIVHEIVKPRTMAGRIDRKKQIYKMKQDFRVLALLESTRKTISNALACLPCRKEKGQVTGNGLNCSISTQFSYEVRLARNYIKSWGIGVNGWAMPTSDDGTDDSLGLDTFFKELRSTQCS